MVRSRVGALSLAALAVSLLASACSTVSYTQDFDRQAAPIRPATWSWSPPAAARESAMARISPFLQTRIERAVARELEERGFTRSSDRPRYLVTAYPILPDRRPRTAVRSRSSVRVSAGIGVGWGRSYGGWWRPYPYRGWWGFAGRPAYDYWGPYAWPLGWTWPYYGYPAYGWVPMVGFTVAPAAGHGRSAVGTGDRGPGSLVIEVLAAKDRSVIWQGVARGALLDMPPADEMDDYVREVVSRTLEGFPPRESG